jgi:hypothetical protein
MSQGALAWAAGMDEEPENTRLIVIINSTNRRFTTLLLTFNSRSSFMLAYFIRTLPCSFLRPH